MTSYDDSAGGPVSADLEQLLTRDGQSPLERLAHWAATTPDRIAMYYGEDDSETTFAELARLTDSIAGNLAARGVTKGDRVSVLTTNSRLAALAMFGIWKAGAVYSPVNFSFAGRLLAYQLDDTAPALIITDAELIGRIDDVADELSTVPPVYLLGTAHRATVVSGSWDELVADHAAPKVQIEFDDPANLIYTSGTTGPAKGVLQPVRWMAQYTFGLRCSLTPDDVVYNDLPMYHVGGAIANVARAIWRGCEVALWDRFSPSEFWSRIDRRGATTAILLDVMIPWLLNAEPSATDAHNTLNKVYMQPLPGHHAQVAARFGFDFVNAGFGQTESGASLAVLIDETEIGAATPPEFYRGYSREQMRAVAAAHRMTVLGAGQVTRKGLMGAPTPFLTVAVLDDDDRPCGVEEPGQLALRPNLPGLLMTEYLGKPDKTIECWRNLWLHTGDSVVRDADGVFHFIDRMGDRIRVRGENLSSYQVEDLLTQHPAVTMCAAFAVRSGEGDEDDIVACVVSEGSELTEDDIHRFAAETMPKFMRPRHVRILDDLPRTPTNKIEKYKLRRAIAAEVNREN
ncbi:AMP-binding protein [Gordonia sp. PP30]|uniref:AMP-binding protein n=1 Tax=Gordonia sp. PP30 TaxID=2935861 RepID=UPI0020001838|nr:AMP-binding protein [Gordonia sp. PP30]UQE75257.1 AMP-binding protein [Gordonia sp. PP30]